MGWMLDTDALNSGLSLVALVVSLLMCGLAMGYTGQGRERTAFCGMCLANAAMSAGDCLSWAAPLPLSDEMMGLVLAGNFVFNAATAILFWCFSAYLHAVLERPGRGQGLRPRYPLERPARVLMVALLLGCVASIFAPVFFTVRPNTRYFRGDLFWLMQALVILLYAQSLLVIVANRACVSRGELLALLSYVLLPTVADIVQSLAFGFAFINLAIMSSLVLIFMGVHQRRELEAAGGERRVAEGRLALIEARIDPEELYARLDGARAALDEDPSLAARKIGETSRWLRARMHDMRAADHK